jgi:hypothetical protein
MKRLYFSAAIAASAALAGCELPDLPVAPAPVAAPVEAVAEAPPAPAPEVGPNGTEVPPMAYPVTHTPRVFLPSDPIEGRRSAASGQMGVPFKAAFYAKHQTMILQIRHSLDIYAAAQGLDLTYPKTQQIFMDEIIKANGIKLPKLDDPVEYIYVPEQGEKGLQIRLKDSYAGDIWPEGATLPPDYNSMTPGKPQDDGQQDAAIAPDPSAEPPVQRGEVPPAEEPAPRAVGVEGMGGAAGVAPLDLQ